MEEITENPLDGLEERYLKHEKAFESLLALTPAREYYGSQIDDGLDPSEQWNRKKQTKEQKKAAKKAKLDPANQKTALDVMKEREKKRKRELGIEDDEEPADELEKVPSSKKQKQELSAEDSEAKRQEKVDKRRQKREEKKQKAATKREKVEAKKSAKQDKDLAEAQAENQAGAGAAREDEQDASDGEVDEGPQSTARSGDMEKVDVSGLADPEPKSDNHEADADGADDESSAPTSPAVNSPAFDTATNHSEASSSSSIAPPPGPEKSKDSTQSAVSLAKPALKLDLSDQKAPITQKALPSFTDPASGTSSPKLQLPDIDQAQLQERLRNRIEALRAQRKADGADGKPAKSRQELLDQRRKKEEQRKANKKELRRQAKEEEARKREEQLRGSGSPLSTDIFSRNSPRPQENNFSFSRLAFEDGTAADPSISELRDPKRKKGPQDPRTALQAAEKKQQRLSGLDAEKRADIAEKDMWLNAKKRVHGERVRDDTSLLKKALKRKEKQKDKSDKEWKEREQAVIKGKEAKQKKREANLQKRREEKGQKGKKKPSGGKGKKKGRPGFEGRFKA
ncbi:Hypothetical predicted protein [Lecanosticta acicola]|uniref:SURF6-domain-containing protein n=1 Tax=Lecanosticta acicola TaxID=111012 RepID=A0AAI8YZS3_9PEZI|nr:Hypothetical predicted protein [Lecanosticta acicola]